MPSTRMVSVVSLAKSAQSESEEGWVPWKAAQGQGQTHEMNYNDMHSSTFDRARVFTLGIGMRPAEPSSISVVATSPDTQVTITPSAPCDGGSGILPLPPRVPPLVTPRASASTLKERSLPRASSNAAPASPPGAT